MHKGLWFGGCRSGRWDYNRPPAARHSALPAGAGRDLERRAVIARDFKGIESPAQVGTDYDDLTLVQAPRWPAAVALQQQSVLVHQPYLQWSMHFGTRDAH